MDMSVVEGEEKTVHVKEVPEYAAEIHTYLREMEVRHCMSSTRLRSRDATMIKLVIFNTFLIIWTTIVQMLNF